MNEYQYEKRCISKPNSIGAIYRGAISIWLMKTPAALTPPSVLDIVRSVTARVPLQPEKPTATRKSAGKNRPQDTRRSHVINKW